jgi:hypothetical protein
MRAGNLFLLVSTAMALQTASAASQETSMYCDVLCWTKDASATCYRTMETTEELQGWQQFSFAGKLKIGNPATLTSLDAGSTLPCYTAAPRTPLAVALLLRYVPITGFVNGTICAASTADKVGDTTFIRVCGIVNDGKTSNFFLSK